MAGNSFGTLFRFTTWGESHGEAIGCVVDGCPSLIPLSEADIQPWLDKRKPGSSKFVTQRKEGDVVKIYSGVFEGKTTGAPISLIIHNEDQKSKDYDEIKDKFRPGHADYTYWKKYGIRDYRGGGRSSARETAMRVAAGAVARKILNPSPTEGEGWAASPEASWRRGMGGPGGMAPSEQNRTAPSPNPSLRGRGNITIRGAVVQMGPHRINRDNWSWSEVEQNPFWCPDKKTAAKWEDYLIGVRKEGSSIGAVIEVVAEGVPVGLGEPIYDKLDSDLARALMSINAVKGVEIGDGFASAELRGEENADRMRMKKSSPSGRGLGEGADFADDVEFLSNHAGGILGGISTGQPIVARFAVKPTSSILTPVETIDIHGNETEILTKGRHDPCVGIRAVPIGEAMMACVLADHLLRHKALSGQ